MRFTGEKCPLFTISHADKTHLTSPLNRLFELANQLALLLLKQDLLNMTNTYVHAYVS